MADSVPVTLPELLQMIGARDVELERFRQSIEQLRREHGELLEALEKAQLDLARIRGDNLNGTSVYDTDSALISSHE